VTRDNEELVFSKTFYRISNRPEVRSALLKIRGFEIREENKDEDVITWLSTKNIILGSIFITGRRLRFETNSEERLEKWRLKTKKIPLEFLETEYIDYQNIFEKEAEKPSSKNRGTGETGPLEIPEEAMKEFALDWWNNYYDEWVTQKIPALGNKTPRNAVKTKTGRQKVIDLIDDYENKSLRAIKSGANNNLQKFFDADELRKRLDLIKEE